MMPYIYCNSIYPKIVKGNLIKKDCLQYIQCDVPSYPFLRADGSRNDGLLSEILRACSFILISASAGEYWTSIQDPGDSTVWGLFMISEPCLVQNDKKKGEYFCLTYALCPMDSIPFLSRTELISCLNHVQLLKKWGKCNLEGRKIRYPKPSAKSRSILNCLSSYPAAQLIYGDIYEKDAAYWFEQVWRNFSYHGINSSVFFSYSSCYCQQFLTLQVYLPQILLFPGRIFDTMSPDAADLPLRDKSTDERAGILKISPMQGKSGYYGILLYPGKARDMIRQLAEMPENIIHANQLDGKLLERINKENRSSKKTISSDKRLILYHLRRNKSIEILSFPYVIGRNQDSDYAISDNNSISGKNTVILYEKDCFFIQDVGSRNGTIVDGKHLKEGERCLLADGMQFYVSNELFRVSFV